MGEIILSAEGVVKAYGGLMALNNVDFHVAQGEIVSIVGPNGSGKTTLYDCITGFTRMDAGKVVFLGENITGLPPHEISRIGIARTFQLTRVFSGVTVLENLILGQQKFLATRLWKETRSIFGESGLNESTDVAMKLIEQVKLSARAYALAGSLPIGERKRLEVAIALVTKPKLLLLDEPTSGMNPSEIDEVIDILHHISAAGLTIVIVEHHMRVVMMISDRIVVLDSGHKISEGKPEEVSTDPAVIEVYLGTKGSIAGS